MSQKPDVETENESVRLDRWLFAVRVFKTRSLAAKAIAGGKIKVNGVSAKAHRPLKLGDVVVLKREGHCYQYEVKGLIEKRVGAAEAEKQYSLTEDADLNPEMRDMMKLYLEIDRQNRTSRGRPSKRDRRLMEKQRGDF